MIFKHLKKS